MFKKLPGTLFSFPVGTALSERSGGAAVEGADAASEDATRQSFKYGFMLGGRCPPRTPHYGPPAPIDGPLIGH